MMSWRERAKFGRGSSALSSVQLNHPPFGEEHFVSACPGSGLLAQPVALHSPTRSGLLQRFKQKLINFIIFRSSFLSRKPNYDVVVSLKLKMHLQAFTCGYF